MVILAHNVRQNTITEKHEDRDRQTDVQTERQRSEAAIGETEREKGERENWICDRREREIRKFHVKKY